MFPVYKCISLIKYVRRIFGFLIELFQSFTFSQRPCFTILSLQNRKKELKFLFVMFCNYMRVNLNTVSPCILSHLSYNLYKLSKQTILSIKYEFN